MTLSNTYRFFNNACGTTRRIQSVDANLAATLSAGTYWLEWSAAGTSTSGPWAPSVTVEGQQQAPGANAKQLTAAGWTQLMENSGTGPGQDFAFEVLGTQGGGWYPDCNCDGQLNLADFGCLQTRFALGNSYADCNGDGQLNLADFGCFQTKFALGCP